MLYGIYNVITGEFTYASAGMNTSPLILKADGRVAVLKQTDFPYANSDHTTNRPIRAGQRI